MRLKNKDIAQKLNLSPSAVSLAINNKPGVSDATRQRVLNFINEEANASLSLPIFDYQPIIFIIHKKHGKVIVDNSFFSNMLTDAQQAASLHGYPLQIIHFLPGQSIDEFIKQLKKIPCSGILLLATELEDSDIACYKSLEKPMVALAGQFISEDVNSVSINNTGALFLSVQYAYMHGHRHFGYLKSELRTSSFQARYNGFIQAIRYFGMDSSQITEYALPPDTAGARTAMTALLENPDIIHSLPSIFVAELDSLALGTMMALKDAHYKIPDDISFIGFDDIPECSVFDPPLTTMSVRRNNIGQLATQRLIDIIQQKDSFCVHSYVDATLKERESVLTLPTNTP